MRKIIFLAISLILFSAFRADAQNGSGDVYTLEMCYDMVRENYPLVKRYELMELAEVYTLKNAYMMYFPQISVAGQASYQTDVLKFPFDIPFLELPTYSKDQYNVLLELSQVLWDGGEIAANRRNIRAKADVDEAQLEIDMYALRERVDNIYFGILLINEQLVQTDLMLAELERERKRVESCVDLGVANSTDADMVDVEILTQNQNRESISSQLEAYLRMLTLMTGVKIDDADMLISPIPKGTDLRSYLKSIVEEDVKRPELQLFSAQLRQADTQLDYWIAGGMPKVKIFIRGGYGRPGLDMLDNSFQPYAVGGIKLVWNISELYSLGYGKKVVKYNKQQIEAGRETFLYNLELQQQQKIMDIERYFRVLEDDARIVALQEKITGAAEKEVENGTMNASDLLREMNKEDMAKKRELLHKIELAKAIYELKNIKNSEL